MKWGVSVVFIANAPRYKLRVRVIPHAYGAGDDGKRVTRVSQFTAMEQERERKIEKARKAVSAVHALVLVDSAMNCMSILAFQSISRSGL